jgi:hypothetical protein
LAKAAERDKIGEFTRHALDVLMRELAPMASPVPPESLRNGDYTRDRHQWQQVTRQILDSIRQHRRNNCLSLCQRFLLTRPKS